ncbi:MAG: sigma-70 family RNA polymerase sigma factor [Solirubrobacteraceae bacterium]
MASLESLPADQRAVLELVLQRGRSYDEIARLLSIDRSAVRQRAVSALEALGPQTGLEGERRRVITDYLLGQLDSGAASAAQDAIAAAPGERAWARVVASELDPLASSPLPPIPAAAAGPPPTPSVPAPAPPAPATPTPGTAPDPAAPKRERQSIFAGRRRAQASGAAAPEPTVPSEERSGRSSLLGGGVLIALTVIIVAAVVVILLNAGGSGPTPAASASSSTVSPAAASPPAGSATTGANAASGTTTSGGSPAAKVVAQISLTPPAAGSKAAGIAEILKEGTANGIAIVAQHVTPNTKKPPTAYAVWLYNSPTDAHILGFVNPGVTATGKLSTAGGLPTNAAHYKQLVVTLETKASPTTPGTIILQGTLTGLTG